MSSKVKQSAEQSNISKNLNEQLLNCFSRSFAEIVLLWKAHTPQMLSFIVQQSPYWCKSEHEDKLAADCDDN